MEKYDYIIVGAGLAGGVVARKLAENGKRILIVERRNHIAGNTYDYCNVKGIKVQKYGPHAIHTDNEEVYKFIAQFCEPVAYQTKCETVIDDLCTPSPFNFKTIDQLYPEEDAKILKEKLLSFYKGKASVTIVEMLKAPDDDIRSFAEFLFEKDYRPYTAKQWNLDPAEIDPSVLKRVPIVLSYSDTYFYDRYEFIPKDGFAALYDNMIAHPNIDIELNVDGLKQITFDLDNKKIFYNGNGIHIIYTGAIDELFRYRFGILPYRSLFFVYKSVRLESYQNVAIVAYPKAEGYTRITEYTKMPYQDGLGWTTIAFEYPVNYDKNAKKGNEPYYPVLTKESQRVYKKYKEFADQFKNLTLIGRLAEFKYYNMDQVILRAIEVAKVIVGGEYDSTV